MEDDAEYAAKRAEELGMPAEAAVLRQGAALGMGAGVATMALAGFGRPLHTPSAPHTIRTPDGRVHEVRSMRAAPKNKAGLIQVAPGLWMAKPKPKKFKGSKAAKKASRRR